MSEYSKMKNAELETLLKERGLAHTGKKADLIKRLQESDSKKNEDEIDWDDEPAAAASTTAPATAATTESTQPTSEPAAAAVAAGGTGQPPNPQAVPNQVADIDPSTTNDLTVSKPETESAPAQEPGAAASAESAAAPAPVEEKPAPDFTSGLATTTLDQEIEKRKARAKKFGLEESDDAALKALERAKRFGGSELHSKLNEALPERRERKRGREGEDGTAAAKKKKGGQSQGQGQSQQQAQGQGRGGQRNGRSQAKTEKPAAGSWMTEADKAKAEARKAKFG